MEKMKIILLGETNVGKTALLHRFKTGQYDETLPLTLQPELHSKKIRLDDEEIEVTIWDTAGQERFHSLASSYFRDVEGVLLLYDVTNLNSFLALRNWVDTMIKFNEDSPILIVGNKNDEDPRRKKVNLSVVHNFVRECNFDNIEISAKTGENVEEAFLCLFRKVFLAKLEATANKVTAQGFSYTSVTEKEDTKDDVIKLTKDANIQTERSRDSWCSC